MEKKRMKLEKWQKKLLMRYIVDHIRCCGAYVLGISLILSGFMVATILMGEVLKEHHPETYLWIVVALAYSTVSSLWVAFMVTETIGYIKHYTRGEEK